MSLFSDHCDKWKDGCGSDACGGVKRRVFYRGAIPCDVLFVGEAPGESEDVIGRPFVGPAGRLLDTVVERSIGEWNRHCAADGLAPLRVGFTNMVCCIPRDADGGKATEPDDDQIEACGPRLIELVEIATPRLIIAVGRIPKDFLTPGFKYSVKIPKTPMVDITHPAAILRANVANRGLMVQRAVVVLRNALEEFLN